MCKEAASPADRTGFGFGRNAPAGQRFDVTSRALAQGNSASTRLGCLGSAGARCRFEPGDTRRRSTLQTLESAMKAEACRRRRTPVGRGHRRPSAGLDLGRLLLGERDRQPRRRSRSTRASAFSPFRWRGPRGPERGSDRPRKARYPRFARGLSGREMLVPEAEQGLATFAACRREPRARRIAPGR